MPIIRVIYDMIYKKKGNCVVGVTGRVNTGKSHMSVNLGAKTDSKFKLEESLVYSVKDLIARSLSYLKYKGKPLSFEKIEGISDVKQWLQDNMKHITITPGKVVIMDEAGALGAYVREFWSMDNKTLSKIIQIWRVLRMLCVFVVPEDMSLAESTITKFLNIEVKMLGLQDGYADCIAWKYIGYNKKTREPIRRRVTGCRNAGLIHVRPLPKDLHDAYETFSKSEKIHALIGMGKEYKANEPIEAGRSRTVWDDIEYVRENREKFTNEKGQITTPLIRLNLGISDHKARMIQAQLRKTLNSESGSEGGVNIHNIDNEEEKKKKSKKASRHSTFYKKDRIFKRSRDNNKAG